MMINLLDNAVKYTNRGEIVIAADVRDKKCTFKSETRVLGYRGDISHVFERFYVVDKSRSSKIGGTGLGLFIVKHIVLLHHGTIDVDSTLGKGTSLTIILPADLFIS